MPIYMLYRSRTKPEHIVKLDELRAEFEGIYKKHEINIVGFWENAEDPSEVYYLSKYEDEADYKRRTEMLRSDERYIQLSKELDEIRVDSKATRLNPKWVP
ncbi:MAG: NIPSNAP family protein [Candidatus Thorarchaeota archaeon]